MSHKPTRLDVITDLQRSIMASFSKDGFNNVNAKCFLQKAEDNLKIINLDKEQYSQIVIRFKKAEDPKQPIEYRREDLLMVASIV
jgi:hypothetical protein